MHTSAIFIFIILHTSAKSKNISHENHWLLASNFVINSHVLVRADDHAVLLVDEAVHLRPYLFDGGFHLLAVDADGYPAGLAGLCHN